MYSGCQAECPEDKSGVASLWLSPPLRSLTSCMRICKTIGWITLATQNAVLTHIPSHVCNENAVFLEHFKVRKPLSHIASSPALWPLPPSPGTSPPFYRRGTQDKD